MSDPGGAQLGQPTLGRRHVLIATITAILFVALIGRLWVLQVAGSSGYDQVASGNRTRIVTVEGPRGRILDAEDRELAISVPVLTLTLDWQPLVGLSSEERSEVWSRTAAELAAAGHDLGTDDLESRYEASVGRELWPVALASDIEPELWVVLAERNLPGIGVEERLERRYPNGTVAAHVIGHMGTVTSPKEADELSGGLAGGTSRYRPGDAVGRSGIERIHEASLRGRPEIRRVEVDATGRIVRTVEVVQAARPGLDVSLTVDLDLQTAAEKAMASRLELARHQPPSCTQCPPQRAGAGSVVAIRPSDGAVLALASYPSFDPNWFTDDGSDAVLAAALVDDDRPLLNRAISGQYPPGSTFKPVVAHAAVRTGFRSPDAVWTDEGRYELTSCGAGTQAGCVFRNAGGVVMGDVDLTAALARSSDTYFYSIGEGLWAGRDGFGPTPIQDTARAWGLGARSGIELGGETAGVVPMPDGAQWFAGDNVNLAIGQGDLLVTPLQLANLYATIANDGHLPRPTVVRTAGEPSGDRPEVDGADPTPRRPLDPVAGPAIEAGLARATTTGTAASAFVGFPLASHPVAGKTGTAQVSGKADYSLFAGYAMGEGADLAVAVVLEEAGWGATAAAPTARAVFEAASVPEETP